MLHILLMILKIVGIALMVVSGILAAAVLLILLVPVRYRLRCGYKEKPAASARITWLLHAISALVVYDGGLKVTVRLLGFLVFSLGEDGEHEAAPESSEGEGNEAAPESLKDEGNEAAPEPREGEGHGEQQGHSAEKDFGEVVPSGQETEEDFGEVVPSGQEAEEDFGEEIFGPGSDRNERRYEDGAAGDEDTVAGVDSGGDEYGADEDGAAGDRADDGGIFEKVEYLFSAICDKLNIIDQKRIMLKRFLENSNTQYTIRLLIKQLKKIIRHLIPRKATGSVTVGFDDPAVTGQVLAVCGALCAWYGDSLVITPDFENPILEGDLDVRGRIRLGALVWAAARVAVDRHFRATVRTIRKIHAKGGI